ncbi:MAG: hypothetical protein U9O64_05525 [Campylobacterota bacterium]|nr:hypothetical protein [Campylobacterota bacterium]
MKIFVMLLIMIAQLYALNQNGLLVGEWQSVNQVNNKGTLTLEKEYLNLNADNTFSILLLVSVQKGDAFVRDLQIKGSGIWKSHKDRLVYVIQKVDVPFAKEVYRISQASLRQLANHFKHRFDQQPIRIIKIGQMNKNQLTLINEEEKVTHYRR